MYYYGGYNNMNSCGNNYTPYMYSYSGTGNNAAIVLVLFILLVIILGTRVFNNN